MRDESTDNTPRERTLIGFGYEPHLNDREGFRPVSKHLQRINAYVKLFGQSFEQRDPSRLLRDRDGYDHGEERFAPAALPLYWSMAQTTRRLEARLTYVKRPTLVV